MTVNQSQHRQAATVLARPVPGRSNLLHLAVQDDGLHGAGLARGAVLEAERGRQPADGDLVWVELVRRGTLTHLLRRYLVCEGVVILADPAGHEPSIIRQPGEVMVRAVVITPVGRA